MAGTGEKRAGGRIGGPAAAVRGASGAGSGGRIGGHGDSRGLGLSRFADLAGVRLYRRNAFAVTGLPANAQGRAVRQQRQRLEARLAVGESWAGDAVSPSTDGYRRDEVRSAFEELQDPRRRLVDELLWRWDEVDLGCDCPRSLHADHDAAVRSHLLALEAETEHGHVPVGNRNAMWGSAARTWGRLLGQPAFRTHIAHRIRALDDPRLAAHTADEFLAALPRLLVSPFTELAADPAFRARLAKVCAGWVEQQAFSGLFFELFEEMVEERTERIEKGVRSAVGLQNTQKYPDAARILLREVVPAFEELGDFRAFLSNWQHEEAAHVVAVSLNNLAVALQRHHLYRRPSESQRRTILELVDKAYEITPDRDAKAIETNWAAIQDQFTHLGPSGSGPHRGDRGGTGSTWVALVMASPIVLAFFLGLAAGGVLPVLAVALVCGAAFWLWCLRGRAGARRKRRR
ncbi:hypothetical protein ACGFY7_08130 [Streptomyces prunicolor]|uniref:hypothetical protein n=1 Tax=Streptomyces prunicolor TaxID=67348 RepID=UPI003719DB56